MKSEAVMLRLQENKIIRDAYIKSKQADKEIKNAESLQEKQKADLAENKQQESKLIEKARQVQAEELKKERQAQLALDMLVMQDMLSKQAAEINAEYEQAKQVLSKQANKRYDN